MRGPRRGGVGAACDPAVDDVVARAGPARDGGRAIWFRKVLDGQGAPPHFFSADDPDGEFDGVAADPALVEKAWRVWRAEVEFAERFVEEAPSLDATVDSVGQGIVSLRWILLHTLEEYARHNGHADLLREQIDGRVGE